MNPMTRRVVFASVLAATLAAAGCKNMGSGGGGKSDAKGPAASSSKSVPANAARVAENTHGRLIHRAQRAGTVWVQDGTTGAVIYSGAVRADSNVVVDANADAVTVNDIQVKHAPKLDPDHTYRLYFKGQ